MANILNLFRQGVVGFIGDWLGVAVLRIRLCESEQLCELGVEHPRRKKSGQSPVLETLWNDRVACLRFRRAECDVDGFAQTLRG